MNVQWHLFIQVFILFNTFEVFFILILDIFNQFYAWQFSYFLLV